MTITYQPLTKPIKKYKSAHHTITEVGALFLRTRLFKDTPTILVTAPFCRAQRPPPSSEAHRLGRWSRDRLPWQQSPCVVYETNYSFICSLPNYIYGPGKGGRLCVTCFLIYYTLLCVGQRLEGLKVTVSLTCNRIKSTPSGCSHSV
jgi:hypothetical protein